MTDQQTTPNANDPPEQTKPDQTNRRQQEQEPRAVSAAQQDRRPAPGRRPLFRN
jgi:hypothetical protein